MINNIINETCNIVRKTTPVLSIIVIGIILWCIVKGGSSND